AQEIGNRVALPALVIELASCERILPKHRKRGGKLFVPHASPFSRDRIPEIFLKVRHPDFGGDLIKPGRQNFRCTGVCREHSYGCDQHTYDEVAPLHSITSSAWASSEGSTVRPSALAVLRLITNSYVVGVCTGMSAGFSPF